MGSPLGNAIREDATWAARIAEGARSSRFLSLITAGLSTAAGVSTFMFGEDVLHSYAHLGSYSDEATYALSAFFALCAATSLYSAAVSGTHATKFDSNATRFRQRAEQADAL